MKKHRNRHIHRAVPTHFLWVGFFVLGLGVSAHAQTITLQYTETPLNEILLDLNTRHGVQVSIDASIAQGCKLSLASEYATMQEALTALADGCGLEMQQIAGVYSFRPRKEAPPTETRTTDAPIYLYQGQVVAKATGEPLPYTVVRLGDRGLVADAQGRFAMQTEHPEETMHGEHLGYRIADTLLAAGENLVLALEDNPLKLGEVEVTQVPLLSVAWVGERAGHMQVNDISNSHLPGNTNNLIFNNLRMYPGITAAGEAGADYIIWGSYPGQNYITFDGITLFSSWGVNNEVGRINPTMVKNVEVYKGGYPVPLGDRIGGVILMEGRDGSRSQYQADMQVTNQLASGYISVPLLNQRAALQVAGRKVFFPAFTPTESQMPDQLDVVTESEYADLNAKLSVDLTDQDWVSLSFISSADKYAEIFPIRNGEGRSLEQEIESAQLGASLRYTHAWGDGGTTHVHASHSNYEPKRSSEVYFLNGSGLQEENEVGWEHQISEWQARIVHTLPAKGRHVVSGSLGWMQQATDMETSAPNQVGVLPDLLHNRLTGYVQDGIQLAPGWTLDMGLKMDWAPGDAMYWQPRVQTNYRANPQWRFNAAWGLYNQFLGQTPQIDRQGNERELWRVANGDDIPVMSAEHRVVGASWYGAGLQVSVSGFQKFSDGIGRYPYDRDSTLQVFEVGEGQVQGFDVYARISQGAHTAWGAYTYTEAQERFGDQRLWRTADHTPLHELKGVYELALDRFAVSITHVYGSATNREGRDYHRTDLSTAYFLPFAKVDAEVGLSILNLTNRTNYRVNSTVQDRSGQSYRTRGVPFTPTLYVRIRLDRTRGELQSAMQRRSSE